MTFRRTQIKIIWAHFMVALIITSVQPLLPVFQKEFGIGLFESSILPMTITVSLLIANLFMGFLIAHLGQKTVMLGAVLLKLAGIICIIFSTSLLSLMVGLALVGFAAGAAFTALVTVYSELPEKYQNFGVYHGFFGLGGMAAPLFVTLWSSTGQNFRGLFVIYAGSFIVLFLVLLFSREIENLKFRDFAASKMVKALSSPLILVAVALLSFYSPIEVGGGTWSVNANMQIYGLDQALASLILSGFWLAFTLSRMSTDFIARRTGTLNLVWISTAIGAVVIILFSLGVSPYLFALLGLAIGPVFPVVQKEVNMRLPREQKGLFNGVAYLGTGIANSVFTPLMGGIGERSLSYSYLILLVNLALIALLVQYLRRR